MFLAFGAALRQLRGLKAVHGRRPADGVYGEDGAGFGREDQFGHCDPAVLAEHFNGTAVHEDGELVGPLLGQDGSCVNGAEGCVEVCPAGFAPVHEECGLPGPDPHTGSLRTVSTQDETELLCASGGEADVNALDGAGRAQNFSDLTRKLRLAHARRLLERSDKAISDICYEVGFSNLSNFNRHFLNDAGETPRNYRQRVQNGL